MSCLTGELLSRGGYSLYVGWYGCAAILTLFLTFWGLNSIFLGYFFSSTNTKTIFWGIKTTNSYRIRSFRPQISSFPRSSWVQVSAASGTPSSVFGPSTPPGTVICLLWGSVTKSTALYYDAALNATRIGLSLHAKLLQTEIPDNWRHLHARKTCFDMKRKLTHT